jgi:D-amino peptidase
MKICMMTDLEGVAGVVSFTEQSYPDAKYYEAAKKLLTAEVNAAVEGLLEAGVDDVLVVDGHGSGGIVYEALHPAARLMHGRPLAPASVRSPIVATYDACMMIGQHAMAGTVDGNQNHTQSSRTIDYYTLNGRPIGEIAQFALYCGALGLPMILLSGDDAACREAEALVPGITTVPVKQGLSRGSAISLSAPEAHRRIREGVGRAVARQRDAPLPPLLWEGPYVLEKRFFHTHIADGVASQPGVERVDGQTVRLYGDDILDIIYR